MLVHVDLVDHEVGLDRDLAVLKHVTQELRSNRLGEGAFQRRGVDDLDLIAHPLLCEERVSEEGELQRSHRALDGHLGDVDDEATALPCLEFVAQRHSALEGVELMDALAPHLRVIHPRRLIGARRRTRRDDEVVVRQRLATHEVHEVRISLDSIHLGSHARDSVGDEAVGRLECLLRRIGAEREEEVTGLVVVHVAGLDDGDLPVRLGQHRSQLVDGHGSCGAGTEDKEPFHGVLLSTTAAAMRGRESRTRLR